MFQRILVPIDGSQTAFRALDVAIELAKQQNALLRVVEVVDLGPLYRASTSGVNIAEIEKAMLQSCQSDLNQATARATRAGVNLETSLIEGSGRRISNDIVDEAQRWKADLIVIGTHGRHGLQRLVLGSVAEGVARTAPAPVLLVRGGG